MNIHRLFWRNLVLSLALAGTSLFTLALNPTLATAASFDPNNLVSDAVFTAKDAMSASSIQNFLISKGSVLTQVSSTDLGDTNGRTAGQIIWDVSREVLTNFGSSAGFGPSNPLNVSLNPQVILATLQKEESLITGAYVPGSAQTNTALQHAMGYGCPDSGGCDPSYNGFLNQVTYAAAQFYLNYYVAANLPAQANYKVGQTYTISGAIYSPYCTTTSMSVTIGNASTSGLYWYTPHVCNGNANFWLYMNTWFSPTVNVFSGAARVIKGVSSDTVYMYWPAQNMKWYVASMNAIQAWGVSAPLETLSDAQVAAIPTGNGSFSQVQKSFNADDVFYLEGGKKYHIRTADVLTYYHLQWSDLASIDDVVLSQLPVGVPIGMLTQSTIRDEVYMTSAGHKYYIADYPTMVNWGFNWSDISKVAQAELDPIPSGGNLNLLGISEDGGAVYLMAMGKRLYIPSLAMMTNWKLDFSMMSVYGRVMNSIIPRGPDLSQVAKGSGPSIYYIENGKKRYVSSEAKLRAKGLSFANLVLVSDSLLNRLDTGPNL